MSGVSIPVSDKKREDLPIYKDPRYLKLVKNYKYKM